MSAFDLWMRGKDAAPKGCIVLVRDGDWYVTFGMDAAQSAAALGMRYERENGEMALRIPWHSAELYLVKLVRAGKKVALGDPLAAQPLGLDAGGAEAVGCRGEGEEAMHSKTREA